MERTDFEPWKSKDVARLLALVENQRRYYQEIVSNLPAGLVVLAATRAVVSSNRWFRQTFEIGVEELRGKNIEQILPSERLIEKIREANVHGIGQPGLTLTHAGKLFRVVILPLRHPDEELEMETLLMISDVSDMPGAPPIAAPAAALPRTPVGPVRVPQSASGKDRLPAILWRADAADFRFTDVNGSPEQMLGYPASHWLRSQDFFRERIHQEDRNAVLAFYRIAVEQSREVSAEFRIAAASGELIWCRETVTLAEPGVLVGVLTIIEQRKQKEQFQITAERVSALRGLSARLAHDLNNPLMIIAGYAEEMLSSLAADDHKRGDLEQIVTAAGRIDNITAQLLQFTRRKAEAGEPVELAGVLARLAENQDVDCRAAAPMWVSAQSKQLQEILLHLVLALRECSPEPSRIRVEIEEAEFGEYRRGAALAPEKYARLTMQCSGAKIDQERAKAIFESFLDPETGTSVARAYATIKEWGGELGLESESPHGSTFSMYLRLAEPPAPASKPKLKAALSAVPAVSEPLRETVLVVDDEAGIRSLMVKILRREGYLVLEAGSAAEAMHSAARHDGPIHLVVTDVLLPDRNGRELATQLRESLPGVKVIYVSGLADDESVRSGALPPGARFLQKPFTLAALIGTVRESLDR